MGHVWLIRLLYCHFDPRVPDDRPSITPRRRGSFFPQSDAGMFVLARFLHVDDAVGLLAERGLREGFMLAPGNVFRPHLEASPWMRFNVAVCADVRVLRWLEGMATK